MSMDGKCVNNDVMENEVRMEDALIMMSWRMKSHPSSCMLVNYGPSQQSSKKEYKPCKWVATAKTISYKDHYTNKEVRAKIQQAIGPHEDLTIVKMQAAVVWLCLPFIRSGQNHLARHSERGKRTRQTEEEVERQHQGMDRPGVRQVPEGSGEQGKMEKTGCEIIFGAPMTLAVMG